MSLLSRRIRSHSDSLCGAPGTPFNLQHHLSRCSCLSSTLFAILSFWSCSGLLCSGSLSPSLSPPCSRQTTTTASFRRTFSKRHRYQARGSESRREREGFERESLKRERESLKRERESQERESLKRERESRESLERQSRERVSRERESLERERETVSRDSLERERESRERERESRERESLERVSRERESQESLERERETTPPPSTAKKQANAFYRWWLI